MTALQYFRQFAPEFNNLADEAVTAWLTSATIFVPPTVPETEKSKLATALYAAHLCWLNKYQRGGVRGNVISERKGDDSRRYEPLHGSDDWLGQSSYGLQYKGLTGAGRHVPAILTRFGTVL